MTKSVDLSLYLVTDSRGMSEEKFYETVKAAVMSGVTMVQLREKGLCAREFYKRAVRLKKICAAAGVPLLINDRVDIALAADADGAHLGADDLPVSAARRILGPYKIIGATAKTVECAREAQKNGADYFGIGAFFPTGTKSDASVMTPEMIRAVADAVDIPAVGIGGLNYENIDIIKNSGVKGAAVSSAVMNAENAGKSARRLREKIGAIL